MDFKRFNYLNEAQDVFLVNNIKSMIFSGYIGVVFGGVSRRGFGRHLVGFSGFLGVVWADIRHSFH